jgi:hypothetical protein
MKDTLAKTRSEDRSRFRVVDLESMALTDSNRLIQDFSAKCGDSDLEITEEFPNLGSMPLPASGKKGSFREVVAVRDLIEINSYPFQWSLLRWDRSPSVRPG